MKAYPNDVQVAVKQYPLHFHKNAKFAAKAALAAQRQGKFFEMSDIMYKNMRALEEDKLAGYAKEAGLNVAKWQKDYADPAIQNELDLQMREAGQIGVRGTPSFYINGKIMPREGRQIDGLKKLVEDEIKKAGK